MQPGKKLPRFTFDLKFSQADKYVQDHEPFEIMRSPKLYQAQCGARANFQKTLRNLTMKETRTRSNFENDRRVFLQKVKARHEQAEKLRDSTTRMLNRMPVLYGNSKPLIERQYILFPQSTVVRTDLPLIKTRGRESHIDVDEDEDTSQSVDKVIVRLPAVAPSPSMVATNYTSDPDDRSGIDLCKSPDLTTPITKNTTKCLVARKTSKTNPRTIADVIQNSKTQAKEGHDCQRLQTDGPTKCALNTHHTQDHMQSKITERLQNHRKMLNASFKRRSLKQLDQLLEKLKLKSRMSLPELNTAPKPMVALDLGGTTPDGRLILTKDDYDGYLYNFRKARTVRLESSKVTNRILEKRIKNFKLEPQLCLRDETAFGKAEHETESHYLS